MTINEILTWAFLTITILPVFYLVFTKDLIRAVFALVVTLLGLAGLYVLLNAELMAVVQILIYAGGVIVLLLFGIMLTRRISSRGVLTQHRSRFMGGLLFILGFGFLSQLIWKTSFVGGSEQTPSMDQVRQIGVLFLTDYLIAFEMIAFILLVALIGAAFLAKKSGNI